MCLPPTSSSNFPGKYFSRREGVRDVRLGVVQWIQTNVSSTRESPFAEPIVVGCAQQRKQMQSHTNICSDKQVEREVRKTGVRKRDQTDRQRYREAEERAVGKQRGSQTERQRHAKIQESMENTHSAKGFVVKSSTHHTHTHTHIGKD